MKIDESKVRDILRNQHIVKAKVLDSIPNYWGLENSPTLEHGILQYINDSAYGDMKSLINDVGINDNSIPFTNLQVVQK